MDLVGRVKKSLCSSDVVSAGGTLVVGVSGGPDSAALIHILARLRYELGVHLHAAHFNHNLRKSARLDQRFVERLAERLNVPCTSEVWRNPPRRPKMSLEELARLKRFDFFQRLAKELKASAVVLGHTRDDLAETVLMRILRGTGLQGMQAILPRRQMEGVCFIRPLLEIRKAEIVRYLKNQRISYRLDPTNRQTRFFRNKIRLRLLPLLEKDYSKNIREVLCHLAETAAVDYAYMEDQAGRLFRQAARYCAQDRRVQLSVKMLKRQPQAIRRMLIRLALQYLQEGANRLMMSPLRGHSHRPGAWQPQSFTYPLALRHVREVEDLLCNRPPGALVHLPGGICVGKRGDSFFFTAQRKT